MKRLILVLSGVVLSFWLGHGAAERLARAATPAACPRYECKTIHAWWPGGADAKITVYRLNTTTTDTTRAVADIFADSSNEKNPVINAEGSYDEWEFPTCFPNCG